MGAPTPSLNVEDEQALLGALHIKSVQDLLSDIPASHRVTQLDLPTGLSEREVFTKLSALAASNQIVDPSKQFLGAGYYHRYIPAMVDMLSSRSEFYTAYTPYQPEISQGTLTAIFEFQSYIADLMGMDMANASLYDGATSVAESIQMAKRLAPKGKDHVVVAGVLSPNWISVIETYNAGYGLDIVFDEEPTLLALTDQTVAVVLPIPDFFGVVNDYSALIAEAKRRGIGVIMAVLNPLAVVMYKTPGEQGADIVCGEAMSLGNPISFGGPALGFIATKIEFVRHIPGRLVGQTQDTDGKVGYVLTYQTREQHIRRESATSNICSNQALMALRATMYMSVLGSQGLQFLATEILEKTHYLADQLRRVPNLHVQTVDRFQDVLVESEGVDWDAVRTALKINGFEMGLELEEVNAYWDNGVLFAVNDFTTTETIDELVALIASVLKVDLSVPKQADRQVLVGREKPLRLPDRSEMEVARHYTYLSTLNFGVDSGFYPLGSCTMKYNYKIQERIAGLAGFAWLHPFQHSSEAQGTLDVLYETDIALSELFGYAAFTLQPAAGAHGEHTGLLIIRAYHRSKGETDRNVILIPDTAHGTNPASAAVAGFSVVKIATDPNGNVDIVSLKAAVLKHKVAALMLTNPSTLGLFETQILEIADIVHQAGGLLYYDGANANALLGIIRPGDMGFDVCHLNLHKTFDTPHGGGGPGSGPVGVKDFLVPFLPCPRVKKSPTGFVWESPNKHSIGRVHGMYGNVAIVLRAYAYILLMGRDGLTQVSEHAILAANYLQLRLKNSLKLPYERICMHEFVLSAAKLKKEVGVSALDLAKGLMDEGVHPPTIYFPQVVHECMMIEPTESETKAGLDRFVSIFTALIEQAHQHPETLKLAPQKTYLRRLDEAKAVKEPRLTLWN